jgi:hypothetical protein
VINNAAARPRGYRCSAWQTCGAGCRHKDLHLAQRLTVQHGNYQTCASHYLKCSTSKQFVICELVRELAGSEKKEEKQVETITG